MSKEKVPQPKAVLDSSYLSGSVHRDHYKFFNLAMGSQPLCQSLCRENSRLESLRQISSSQKILLRLETQDELETYQGKLSRMLEESVRSQRYSAEIHDEIARCNFGLTMLLKTAQVLDPSTEFSQEQRESYLQVLHSAKRHWIAVTREKEERTGRGFNGSLGDQLQTDAHICTTAYVLAQSAPVDVLTSDWDIYLTLSRVLEEFSPKSLQPITMTGLTTMRFNHLFDLMPTILNPPTIHREQAPQEDTFQEEIPLRAKAKRRR